MARLKSENCGRKVLGNTALFLLATRVLPASPNFGQAKHGQNGPAATDCQQCICYPICGHHFTHRTHTDISFRFRPGGRRVKKTVFQEFACRFGKIIRRPAADSILMPPTFHLARLNRYTPNFSGVPQKLTGVNSLASRSSQSEVMPIFVA